ncbi:MAG: hypothetical protein M3537_07015 [Chloroflexota bacterium]|nr:hypothetical protein [Chloroflexota bacterium]
MGLRTVLTGVLGLAAGAAFRPSTANAESLATGATIYSYGHSYTMMPSPYVTRPSHDEYQLQLGRRLASGPVISRGRSGTRLLDTISAIIAPTFAGSAGRRWRIGDKGIVLLHNMMNDVSSEAGGDPDYLNAYEKGLRLALGVFGASSFTHADRASRVGAWKVKVSPRFENGRGWNSRTYRDKISFVVSSGDSVHVSTVCTDPDLLTQGTLRADCNGVVLGYFGRGQDTGTYASNRGKTYTDSVDRVSLNRWTPAGWRITGLNAAAGTSGTKTLTLRKVDNTVAAVWVQGAYLASSTQPPVFVAKEPPRNPDAANKTAVSAFYRNEPAYRALIDSVCNEYGAAYSVDLRPGWNNATMVSKLDTRTRFHPNTLGMSGIADNFERAINKNVTAGSPGLH